jgi:thiol-disulfide isomerase/thioredoxin
MKKTISLLSLLFIVIGGLKAQLGYQIKFNIPNLKEGDKIQFAYYQGEKKLLQDTVFVENGKFELKGAKPLPRGLYIVAIPDFAFFDLVINEDQFFDVSADTKDYIKTAKFKGSQENTDFYEYLKKVQPLQVQQFDKSERYKKDSCTKAENKENASCKILYDSIVGIQKELKRLMDDYIKTFPSYLSAKMLKASNDVEVPMMEHITDEKKRQLDRFNYFKEHYFDNIDFTESGLARTPIFEGKIDYFFDELTYKTCDSSKKSTERVLSYQMQNDMFKYLLSHIYGKYNKSNVMCMDCMELFMFDKYFLKDSRVDWISEENRKKIQEEVWKLEHNQCGNKVYPMTMKDTSGKSHDIHKVDAEYTIVYFWSATCGHCKKTTPKLHEMYKRLKDEYDLEIYTVHIDKSRTEFDKYVKEHKFEWILTIDTGEDQNYRTAYNVFSTPTIYLLNSKKEIIAKKVDITTLEKIITGKDVPEDSDSDH